MASSSSSSSSCGLPVALRPLEETNAVTSFSCSPSPSSQRSSPPRARRPYRVLYPAYQSRRAPLREAPDQARRWLLLLCAVVFMQIYTEETNTCPDLQSQDSAASLTQEGEGSLGTVQGWTGEEPWRVTMVGGASETQLECVVA